MENNAPCWGPCGPFPGASVAYDQDSLPATAFNGGTVMDTSDWTTCIEPIYGSDVTASTQLDIDLSQQELARSYGSFGNMHLISPATITLPGSSATNSSTQLQDLSMSSMWSAGQDLLPTSAPSTFPLEFHDMDKSGMPFGTADNSHPFGGISGSLEVVGEEEYQSSNRLTDVHHHPAQVSQLPQTCDDGWNLLERDLLVDNESVGSVDASAEIAEPCYARLLHRCLLEAPENTLSLKDIYEWIRRHTQKAKDPKSKGWQNSVRHNLSMNAAFERVPTNPSQGLKKGSLWRLTPQAICGGVISTTRYRRDPKKKPERHGMPALKRQLSGAKGGAATRAASKAKRLREAQARSAYMLPYVGQQAFYTAQPGLGFVTAANLHTQNPMSQAPRQSPYFVNGNDASTVLPVQTYSNPHTPPQLHLNCTPQKNWLGEFDMQQVSYNSSGLFDDVGDNNPYTPSLITEASFFTDEGPRGPTSEAMISGF